MTNDEIKILALDEDDLQIISSMLQDAVLRISDIHFEPNEKRAYFVLNRFNWEKCDEGCNEDYCRSISAFAIENVLSMQVKNINQEHKDKYIEILMVGFEEDEKPSGYVKIICANKISIRLKVEYIEAKLFGLGKEWKTVKKPHHKVIET